MIKNSLEQFVSRENDMANFLFSLEVIDPSVISKLDYIKLISVVSVI